uniref:Pseudouridylate synthase RPUSD4, mitochondrial n=1 Tax=Aceria tosichella TaxID=561515 RepID=A0A6G1SQ25_9ACAR
MRQSTIRRLTTRVSYKDFFGINDITSKDVAGAFPSGTKLSTVRIEKKYNPLMGARVRFANEEKDSDKVFGRIRIDSDNVTRKHGQYEPEKTERLHDTVELKQMFVPDGVTERTQVEAQQTNEGQQIDTSSIPNVRQEFRISEVQPVKQISEVLQIFRREGDEKAAALKYKNTPPLTFYFESAIKIESKDTSNTEMMGDDARMGASTTPPPQTIIKSKKRKQQESKEQTDQPTIRRPQVDLDAEAGPEGARAPLHELDELSIELVERQGEFDKNDVGFDRFIDQRFDVSDEPTRPMKAAEYIEEIRNKKLTPIDKNLKQRLDSKERLFPLNPSIRLDSRGFRNYTFQVPDWTNVRRADAIGYLRGSIIYNNYDILAINKPYGIASHANKNKSNDEFDMNTLVSELAKSLKIERIYLAHRLDKTTSGVLLFATSQERARNLNKLFKSDEIKKTYICITKNVPDPQYGIIDMPIGEIEVAGKLRSCPAPQNLDEKKQLSKKYREARRAITEYRVIDFKRHVALVELKPQTGVKHQLRCHMSFGLNTPILGDHKYSHLDKLAPQKLPNSILGAFNLRQSKVRTLPMHLHAKSIVIPGAKANGETLFIDAPLPQYFIDNMKALKLRINP